KLFRLLARLGYQVKPQFFFDMIIRTSAWGDRFGLRRNGISFKKLINQHPYGYNLMPYMPTGEFDKKIRTASKRVDLGQSEIVLEMQRLRDYQDQHEEFPYRLLGQREMLSQNSWLHNVETTMKKGRGQTAKVHPEDANRHGLGDGDVARIESPWGAIDVQVKLTDDMKPGNIALPHGWGHDGGWQRANQGGGVNANILTSDRAEDHEKLSATSLLNGVPIRLSVAGSA
ncbi:MAG: formate dehydrogenase, partial [Gammaproteobacteria bacterium]|nr:formate dehydrogenase [Gammaproteobacteria bacterium]